MTVQYQPPVILLTRPEAQSSRFAAALRDSLGDKAIIVISPLIAPRFLTPVLPRRDWGGLILSSETAAISARRIIAKPLPAFCVGDHTAIVAAQAGYDARSAAGDAKSLLAMILSQHPAGPLLHLHGKEVSFDLGDYLNSAGIETFSVVCYVQDAQPLTKAAKAALSGTAPVFAPLFSSRTADLFVQAALLCGISAPIHPIAISSGVAEIAKRLGATPTIAAHPDADHMLLAITEAVTLKPTLRRH